MPPASLEGTREIKLRRLVKEALRMRPSRVVVGEVRRKESLELTSALDPGFPPTGNGLPLRRYGNRALTVMRRPRREVAPAGQATRERCAVASAESTALSLSWGLVARRPTSGYDIAAFADGPSHRAVTASCRPRRRSPGPRGWRSCCVDHLPDCGWLT